MIISKSKKIVLVLVGASLLSGCLYNSQKIEDTDSFRRISHDFDSKTKVATVNYGVWHLPSGVKDVSEKDATPFKIQLFVEDNNDCKFIYLPSTKSDSAKESVKASGEFTAYFDETTLLSIECTGEKSNVDYKIYIKGNDKKYKVVGSYSYYAESTDF